MWSTIPVHNVPKTLKTKGGHKTYLKFQVSPCLCTSEQREWSKVTLQVPFEFIPWFRALEDQFIQNPWNSHMYHDELSVKWDPETTLFFNDKRELIDAPNTLQGCVLKCMIEVHGTYFFKDQYGFVMNISQCMVSQGPKCLFSPCTFSGPECTLESLCEVEENHPETCPETDTFHEPPSEPDAIS